MSENVEVSLMEKEKNSGFLLGLLVGSMVGAAIAILMAPSSGEETRKFLKENAVDPAKSKVMDLADDFRAKAETVAKDLKERAGDLWEKSKKTVSEKKDSLLESLGNNQDRKRPN